MCDSLHHRFHRRKDNYMIQAKQSYPLQVLFYQLDLDEQVDGL